MQVILDPSLAFCKHVGTNSWSLAHCIGPLPRHTTAEFVSAWPYNDHFGEPALRLRNDILCFDLRADSVRRPQTLAVQISFEAFALKQ